MKVLIANRGEIAVRIIRACREMGFESVAVYSDCDRQALHVRLADEAHHIGPSLAAESYLSIDRLIDVARRSGASFVHPGYGFLAENEDFADACGRAGLTFVGPSPAAIAQMGNKTAARDLAVELGIPVVPGSGAPFDEHAAEDVIAHAADAVGYPLLVKAVAGGGGKGMRAVAAARDLAAAVRLARSEARAAFGDAGIYLERRIVDPRHVEIQLLADWHGVVVPFVERECSIQRRHQKVVEESPSPVLDEATRHRMADAAASIAAAAGYTNAGTIEFLLDRSGAFYFLEMNTRLQVEHPVTEAVTGIDLVHWQFRIAMGERLTVSPDAALTPRGHAIECRIYAEDPDTGFLPSPGLVRAITTPGGPSVRDDRGVAAGFDVPLFYDPLISKLIVWGPTRPDAIRRLTRALDEYRVTGVKTTLPFFRWLAVQPEFAAGQFSTTYLDDVLARRAGQPFVVPSGDEIDEAAVTAALHAWFQRQSPESGATLARRRLAADREDRVAPMTFEFDVCGHRRIVSIDPSGPTDPVEGGDARATRAGGRFRVTLRAVATDGSHADRVLDVDARATDIGLSIVNCATGRVTDAAVTEKGRGVSVIEFPHVTVEVVTVDHRAAGFGGANAGVEGEQRITAPMPGRVLRVLVKPGDEVVARQGLVVIEAMKMENELTAVRAGRVRDVAVTEGATVEAGRLLVRLA